MKKILLLCLMLTSMIAMAINPMKAVDAVSKLLGTQAADSFRVVSKGLGGNGEGLSLKEIEKLKSVVGDSSDLTKLTTIVAKNNISDDEVKDLYRLTARLYAKYDVDAGVLACRVCVSPEAKAKGVEVVFSEFPARKGSQASSEFSKLKKLTRGEKTSILKKEMGVKSVKELGAEEDIERGLMLVAFKKGGNSAERRVAEAILALGSAKSHRLEQMLIDAGANTKSALSFEGVLKQIKVDVDSGKPVKEAFYGYTGNAIKQAEAEGKIAKAKRMRELEADMKRKNCFFKS